MALAKYGGIISELRGKEAGVIFSRNAYGAYMKQKVSPVNPQTGFQQTQRQMFGNLAITWATLTGAQKAAWDNLGTQVTRVNRFGDTTNYTGFSLFMRLNRNALLCGNPQISNAPSIPTLPTLAIGAVSASVGGATLSIAFTPTPIATGFYYQVYMTNNIVTGRRFVKNYYRLVKNLNPALTSPQDLHAAWLVAFVNPLILNAKLFGKIKIIHGASGFDSVPIPFEITVAA